MVNNGQSTLISAMRGRPYVRDLIPRPDTAAGFDPSPGQVDEGFNLDFSPLLTADRRLIDATIKCDIDQVEKMIPVMLDVPTADLAAAAGEDRSAANHPLPLPRAFPLADRAGAGGGDGHGALAASDRRRPLGAGHTISHRTDAGPAPLESPGGMGNVFPNVPQPNHSRSDGIILRKFSAVVKSRARVDHHGRAVERAANCRAAARSPVTIASVCCEP